MSREAAQSWLTKQLGINFPYYSMGKVDSLDLFGANELVIFAFYKHNERRYHNALDIGANLGLHSILMERLGWDVRAFEPDEQIFELCSKNVSANRGEAFFRSRSVGGGVSMISLPVRAAVSDHNGKAQFVRVLDNLTGSHIAGFKDSFGPRETVTVNTVAAGPLFDWADLAKIDAEGHEAVILGCATAEHMKHLDIITEVRGAKEGQKIWDHFSAMDVPMYSQTIGWERCKWVGDIPKHHRDGSLFISTRGGPFQ